MFINFRERGRERVRARERNIDVREKHRSVVPYMTQRDPNQNLGMYPDLEWNQQTFGIQDDALIN